MKQLRRAEIGIPKSCSERNSNAETLNFGKYVRHDIRRIEAKTKLKWKDRQFLVIATEHALGDLEIESQIV